MRPIHTDSIEIVEGKLYAHFNCILFQDKYDNKDLFVGIIPTLKLTAKSLDKEDLNEKLNLVLKKFFSFYQGDKLDKELKRLGWDNNFQPPVSITVPSQALYGKTETKDLEFECI